MERFKKPLRFSVLMGLALMVGLSAVPLAADHFKKLSTDHTSYGVAQLNYGNIPGADSSSTRPAMKLMNPVHVTQVAAVIAYEAARGRFPGTAEVFVTCVVRVLTPHASIGIPEAVFNVKDSPKYVEVIWVPMEAVSLAKGSGKSDKSDKSSKKSNNTRRIADGLGGNFDSGAGNREGNSRLAHPGLFSLPSDDVVAGQRGAAINCVLDGLFDLGMDNDIFSEFGIQ